ncbi:MAG: hypothetical protein AAF732_08265 [Pseudomonadota bacterium]
MNHLESHDLTPGEKTELIEALWLIARSFADQAFGVASVRIQLDQKLVLRSAA